MFELYWKSSIMIIFKPTQNHVAQANSLQAALARSTSTVPSQTVTGNPSMPSVHKQKSGTYWFASPNRNPVGLCKYHHR